MRESDEQKALISWANRSKGKYPGLDRLFHIPNGQFLAGRSAAQRSIRGERLRREGVRAGVPDLFLPVPIGDYAGLFIEMKRRDGGTLTKAQREWGKWLQGAGYRFEVCHGFEDAKDVIDDYYTA